jgi:hypothetical protein
MKQQSKLRTNHQEEQTAELGAAKTTGQAFDSVEELLRHDAGLTQVPPAVARRLRQSIAESDAPRRAWWRRLLD